MLYWLGRRLRQRALTDEYRFAAIACMIGNYSMSRPKEPLRLEDFSPHAAARKRRESDGAGISQSVLEALRKIPGVKFEPGH